MNARRSLTLAALVLVPLLLGARAPSAIREPGKPRDLRPPCNPGAGEPRLVTLPGGGVAMTWFEPRTSGGHTLRFARLEGGRWSRPTVVAAGDSFFVNWADFPVVCAFGTRGVAVAWPWKSGAGTYDYVARIALSPDGGASWGRAVDLHEDRAGSEHGFVSLVPQGDGLRAVWLDGHNLVKGVEEGMADMTLHSRFVAPSGTLAREQEIDGRTCDCCQTAAVRVGEDVLVAYRDRSPEEIRDIALLRLSAGKWGAPATPFADHWKITGCPVNGPALTAAGQRVALAWYTAAADTPRVRVAFSPDGGQRFGAALRLDEGKPMGRAGVALLDDGRAAVSWLESDGEGARLRVRIAGEGERPGTATTVARLPATRGTGVPQLVRDGARLVMAWTESGKQPRVRVAELKLPK